MSDSVTVCGNTPMVQQGIFSEVQLRPLEKHMKPAWILAILDFWQDTPKLKTGYPQKYPQKTLASIVPLWTVKDTK
jgi:hypothetical protein